MIIIELKCGRCGHCFQAEAIDREDPEERHDQGFPICCPKCRSAMVERQRIISRVMPRRSA